MRTTIAVLVATLGVSCASSSGGLAPPDNQMWVGDAIRRASVERAIVAQRVVYPYHFVTGTAELNRLGERDLRVLARHFEEYGGDLAVRRGAASEELHGAREAAVREELLALGLTEDQFELRDRSPGGDGMPGTRVVEMWTAPAGGESGTSSEPMIGGGER